jgi:hypothetical protein
VFSAFARNLFAVMPKPAAATAALNVHASTYRSFKKDPVRRVRGLIDVHDASIGPYRIAAKSGRSAKSEYWDP